MGIDIGTGISIGTGINIGNYNANVLSVSGDYKFVFVAGCWDSTLGQAIGAQFRLTNIRRIPQ
jgi:glyoxylate carboligase